MNGVMVMIMIVFTGATGSISESLKTLESNPWCPICKGAV
jgi:hypothetical protein